MEPLELSEPSLDDDVRLIADRHRRLIIHYLIHDSSKAVSLDTLVDYLDGHGAVASNREAIRAELYHTHLPKMAEHGVIEFDTRGGNVRYHRRVRIETILERIPDD